MANIEKKRKYIDKDGNTIVEVENGADAKNVDITPVNGMNATTVQGAIEELKADSGSGTQPAQVQLSPVQVWSDDFSSAKKVKHYIKSKILNQAYDGGTSDRQWYEFSNELVERDAYQFFGNASIDDTDKLAAHIPFAGSGDKMILNQCYTADNRVTVWLVQLVDANASMRVGYELYSYYNDSPTITNPEWRKCPIGASNEGTGSAVVDFGNAKIGNTSMGFTPSVGQYYFVKISHNDFSSSITVTDANDTTKTKTVSGFGELKCAPFIEWVAGSFNVCKLSITIYGGNCDYYITGDSILMNKAVSAKLDRWAYKFKNDKCPNTVISGRGTSTSHDVALRIMSEIVYLRPKCVIDQNYVNGYIDGQASVLKALCDTFGARYIHTMPTQMATRPYNESGKQSIISSYNTVRFDSATSVNGDVTQGQDTSKFISDKLHVNQAGSLAMYKELVNELGL